MLYLLLILLAVATRLLPHEANVAPIAALALFAGFTASKQQGKWAKIGTYVAPLVALVASDALIGLYTPQVMAAVYAGFGISIFLGVFLQKHYSGANIVLASLAGSIIFYLLTNAAVWAFTPMYAKTLTGLVESYVAALPFFRNSLLGDLLYAGAIFGAYELATHSALTQKVKGLFTANI